jgi:hypothetical protein
MRLLFRMFVLMALIAALPFVGPSQAAAQNNGCEAPDFRTDVRPASKGPATPVALGMRVADILEIDDVNQTITVDLAIRMRWTDPRLADLAGCKLSISSVWFPELILRNSGRLFSRWPETVSVDEGGVVTYMQRKAGTLSSYHSLEDFPFDKQVISIRMYPLDWSIDKLVFEIDEEFTGITPLLNISDWQINNVTAALDEVRINAVGQVRSAYLLNISAERYTGFYVWKILVPVALIVLMSWCVFWIDAQQFGTQLGLSATSVLTMVAFIFATTNMLPKLGYMTRMDSYIAAATFFVFAALLQSLTTGYWATRNRVALAKRIDRTSRWVFPLCFVIVCIIFAWSAV